jgi:hypothetical protein
MTYYITQKRFLVEFANDQIPGAEFAVAAITHLNIHPKAFEVS